MLHAVAEHLRAADRAELLAGDVRRRRQRLELDLAGGVPI